jgi:mannitol/fructose-specific phosphotransferase system IIA component (Ntr-type)
VRIATLVKENLVSADLISHTKDDVLSEIVDALYADNYIRDKRSVLQALLDRESQGTTGIGCGVAVPHARIQDISEVTLFVGISRHGIDFLSDDGEPVRILLLLLTPASDIGAGLKALANIARLVNNKDFTDNLIKASSDAELYNILKYSGEDQKAFAALNEQGRL